MTLTGSPVTIQLTFDPGSSLTKVFYWFEGLEHIQLLLMEPEVIEVEQQSIDAYHQSSSGLTTPENDAWLKTKKRGDDCFAVGYLAKQLQASVRMNRLKYERAVYKLFAAIATIIQTHDLPRQGTRVFYMALLPYSEYPDKEQFQELVDKSLGRFYFRSEKLELTLDEYCSCLPEGFGFTKAVMQEYGERDFTRSDAIAVLMMGHRNSSFLLFSRGQVDRERSKTNNLGFVKLVDEVITQTSGQDRASLTEALYDIGSDIQPDNAFIRSLIKSTDPKNQDREAEKIARAIQMARKQTWKAIREWLNENCPTRLDALVIGGGAAHYFKPELDEEFHWAKPQWMELPKECRYALEEWSSTSNLESLQYRLVDVGQLFMMTFNMTIDRTGEQLQEV